MSVSSRERAGPGLLAVAALLASLYVALGAPGVGDYPGDGGPAMNALLRGDLHAFAAAKPAMGTFSLLLRLPFAAAAYLGSPTQLSIYRWGAVPCVAAIGLLGVWLAGLARRRGTGAFGQLAIVGLAIFNPFVSSALAYGHPEELLTASLAIGAVAAAAHRRHLAAVVLLGLALASKQWAVIVVLPVLVALGSGRLRALAGAAAIAAVVSLPAIVGSPTAFLANHVALVHEHYLEPSVYSWLYPLAPRVTIPLAGGLFYRGAQLPSTLVGLLHPLIIVVALAVAVQLSRLARPRPSIDHLFAAVALAFLLRCTLDTETAPYYHAPLLATLLAWDAVRGERVPLRAITAAVVGYALFDRLTPSVVSPGAVAFLYAAVTVPAALALAALLRGAPRRAAGRIGAAPVSGRPGPGAPWPVPRGPARRSARW